MRIGAYIKAKQSHLQKTHGDNLPNEDREWIEWASKYASSINPLE